jgi:hypothetical protein
LVKAKRRVPALRGRASHHFWLSARRLRSNFVAARLAETENRTQHTGNPENVGSNLCAQIERISSSRGANITRPQTEFPTARSPELAIAG